MKFFCSLAMAFAAAGAFAAGPFALKDGDDLALTWQGSPLIQNERFSLLDQDGFAACEKREETLDGNQVINHFGQSKSVPFRREIVIKDGGKEAEISFQFNVFAYSEAADYQVKYYALTLPFQLFAGWKYEAVVGRIDSAKTMEGVIAPDAKDGASLIEKSPVRQVKLTSPDGKRSIVLDWSPEGVNDFYSDYACNSITCAWSFYREKDNIVISAGYKPPFYGGSMACKLMVYEGTPENDYKLRHAQKDYPYYSQLPADRQYLFGAKKFGSFYTPVHDAAFSKEKQAGWVKPDALKMQSFRDSGALYSAIASGKNNTFRMSGLRKGVHLITLGIASYDQAVGPMNVTVNGQSILADFSLPKREIAMVTFPLWIENGTAEIAFSGNWQVSTVADQLLQSSAEDFSFRRGFWVSHKGPHPAVLFQSEHYLAEPDYQVGISQYPLPIPGEEMKAPPKKLEYQSAHAEFAPGNDWRSGAVIGAPGPSNAGNLSEFADPKAAEKRLKEMKQENVTLVLNNGLLSRHTFPCHGDRIRKTLRQMTDLGHPMGMHFIDHWDFSLLWNCDSGFRVLTESTGQLQRTIADGLPARGLCPSNPQAREALAEEVLKYIQESNIDGIMVDEATFHGPEFCGCAECRKKFTEETGWVLPADENSPELNNNDSALWRTWQVWREKAVGDFWLALREKIRKVRKDFIFIGYTTHYGIYSDYGSIRFGAAMEQLARTWDMIGTEIMSRNIFASFRSVACFRRMKNMFHRQSPVFGLVYSARDNWGVLYFGWALNNLNAQATWEGSSVPCPEDAPNYRLFDQKAGNFDALTAQSMAKTALLFSTRGRDCNQAASSHAEVMGLSQILEQHHVSHDFLLEADYSPEVLKQYSLVVIGNATSMSKDDVDKLAAYVKAGGNVWLSAFAGSYNDRFMKDDEWYAGKVLLNGSGPDNGNALRFDTVVDPEQKQSWTLQGKHYSVPRKLSGRLQTLMQLKTETGEMLPGLLMGKLGKGKVFYTPSALSESSAAYEMTVGETMTFVPDPAAEAAVWAVFRKIAPESAYVWNPVDVPDQVITSLYTMPDKKLCIHFLNATKSNCKAGDKIPVDVPADAFEPLPETMKFSVAFPAKRVYAASPEWKTPRELPFKMENGQAVVTIPGKTLGGYMIVWLEK